MDRSGRALTNRPGVIGHMGQISRRARSTSPPIKEAQSPPLG
ncbi:hypothetical protein A2U01_0081278, partial [Trifolium medium]|nr:hypothetical protein [Trifolium medium]